MADEVRKVLIRQLSVAFTRQTGKEPLSDWSAFEQFLESSGAAEAFDRAIINGDKPHDIQELAGIFGKEA